MVLRIVSKRAGVQALRTTRFCEARALRQLRLASTATSNLPQDVKDKISREASLLNPDPDADSATAAFVNERAPYMVATYIRPLPVMTRGEGVYLWDMENRKYLDFTAGIAVTSLGHSDPGVTQEIVKQTSSLMHASNLYHNYWTGTLSQLLVTETVKSGAMRDASQAFISNSGTEANEAALKFARKVGHSLDPSGSKIEIVSFRNSFHGRTFGALSATPNPKYQAPFAPMVPGCHYGTYNDIEQLPTLITEKTCGVIVEPIQGEGGVNVATPEFLTALRARCDEVGAVLIFDEIQCGLSRTGTLWAHAHPALAPKDGGKAAHPDILTTAKALGNGFPIGATIIAESTVGKHIKAGDHGTTFGGNPVASRVGHHVLTRLSSNEIKEAVAARSKTFISGLKSLKEKYPQAVSEVRGRGLILGLQLTEPFAGKVGDIVKAARERGLLVITAGEGCLRFVPALTITDERIEEGLNMLDKAMKEVFSSA